VLFDIEHQIEYSGGVRASPLIRVLFAILALQLAFGLQVDVAYAMPTGMQAMTHAGGGADASLSTRISSHDKAAIAQTTSTHASDDACPHHSASSTKSLHAKVPHDNASGKHDCCKSSCQCQCGSLPLAFNLSVTRDIPVTAYLQPGQVSHFAHALADTHFRPPIA